MNDKELAGSLPVVPEIRGIRVFLKQVLEETLREILSKMQVAYPPTLRWGVHQHLQVVQATITSLQSHREILIRDVPAPSTEARTLPPRTSGEYRTVTGWAAQFEADVYSIMRSLCDEHHEGVGRGAEAHEPLSLQTREPYRH